MNQPKQRKIELSFELEQLVSPRRIAELYPNLYTEKELRSLIKNRRYNGLNLAVIKIPGRKLRISIPDFMVWVHSRSSQD